MQTPITSAAVQTVQPLVEHGLREIQAGGTVEHSLREVALAGWLVGRGQTPQNAIRIVEQSEYAGVDGLRRGEPAYEPGYGGATGWPGTGGMPGTGMMPGWPGMGTGMMPGMPGVGAPGGMPGMGVMPPGMPPMPSLPLMPGMTAAPGMGAQMMPYGKGMGQQY
ncbi:MAG TPA: hypothetical protein VK464_18825 [Symbiobacteriaceae bacterium]|jgi:hypothetical protein|nr:hypothetical protein [Symbiobacteriaceae bacterium]